MKRLLPLALASALVLPLAAGAPARAQDDPAKKQADVTALLKSCHAKLQAKDYDGALADLNKVIELDAKNVYAHNLLGFLHHAHTGDLEKALEHYENVITNSTDKRQKAYAHTMRGTIIFTEQWNPKKAVIEYNKALEIYPTSATFLTASNLFHFIRMNDAKFDDDALKAADNAFKYAEQEAKASGQAVPPAYNAKMCAQKAVCLVVKERKDEAAKLLEGLEFDDTAYYNLAQYHALVGDDEKATDYITKAFEARPTPKARNQLRDFVMRDHDFDRLRGGFAWRKLLEREKED